MENFYQGQKLRLVCGPMSIDGDQVFERIGKGDCIDIEVVMESGQMSGVPWAVVTYAPQCSIRKINLALMEFVEYREDQTHENIQTNRQQRTESPSD